MAKVLVVDDAAFMRARACKVLQAHGHEVVQAENGADAVRQYAPAAMEASPAAAVAAARNADMVVLATYDLAQSPTEQNLASSLVDSGTPVIGVALRGPYDAAVATEIGTFLTVYGDRPVHLQAAAEALFGQLTPTGSAP